MHGKGVKTQTFYSQQIQKLNRELYPSKNLTKRIIGAKQFIDRHYSENIDLDDICKEAYVFKYYFIRLFKNKIGNDMGDNLQTLKSVLEKDRNIYKRVFMAHSGFLS